MDRAQLKKIILEEVRRAWAEMNAERAVGAVNAALAGAGVLTAHRPAPGPEGVLIFSGAAPLAPALGAALVSCAQEGWRLRAFLSRSWRRAHAGPAFGLPAGIEIVPKLKDEPAAEAAIAAAAWVAFPQASANTLKKISLGLEDSIPSRAFAAALRAGRPALILEAVSIHAPGMPAPRLETLRAIERLGARLACPESFAGALCSAEAPPRAYKPPPSRAAAPPRRIVTADDVYEAARKGMAELRVPCDAIITSQAHEDAARRGVVIRAED